MLFPPKYLSHILENFSVKDIPGYTGRREAIARWIRSIENGTVRGSTETELQRDFLVTIFAEALGYTTKAGADLWTLDAEFRTKADATHADGYLGFFSPTGKDVRAVIELKDARANLDAKQKGRKDNRSPVEQAFAYAHKSGGSCRWVIVSNFLEIRLYHAGDSTRFQTWNIEDLSEEPNLREFLAILDADRLLSRTGTAPTEEAWQDRRDAEEAVTDAFYREFSSLRTRLFQHLVEHHPQIPELDLFAASQKLLDRLVFIFFCEDTRLLPYKTVADVVDQADSSFSPEDGQVWRQLRGLFRSIDVGNERRKINAFNGGLFAVDPILDEAITVGDATLRELLRLESFDFESELDVNILGHIFEQSISDIEETKAKILGEDFDEKKGKRKKDGVYYTPPFITRYIVDQAIGAVLDDWRSELGFDKLPELTEEDYGTVRETKGRHKGNAAVERHRTYLTAFRKRLTTLRVLDPACGSGAFLVAAFDRLLTEIETTNELIAAISLGQTTTFDLQREILRNNLYGVDINPESVEITKLSLWLKTADRSSELTVLDDRIRVGNSIVDDPEAEGKNPFDWKEAFPEIFGPEGPGGFDVVVGNPPYVRQELLGDLKPWLEKNYEVYAGTADLFVYFFERGVELLRQGGVFSIVVANKWMRANYGKPLREWMAKTRIEEIVDFGDLPVFQGITTYPCIVTLRKGEPTELFRAAEIPSLEFTDLAEHVTEHTIDVRSESLDPNGWTLVNAETQDLLDRLRRENVPLGEYVEGKIYYGIKTGLNDAFVINRETRERLIAEDPKSVDVIKPFLAGRDIKRYMPVEAETWLILFPNGWTYRESESSDEEEAWRWIQHRYPAIARHLADFEERARKRYDQGEFWWELRACDYYEEFEKPKILYAEIATRGQFILDQKSSYGDTTAFLLGTDSKYLLAVMNSSLWTMMFSNISSEIRGGYFRWKRQYMEQLPIHPIDESSPREVQLRDEIESRVGRMLAINAEAESLRKKFLKLLLGTWPIETLSQKLENWYELEWGDFLKELKKKKVKMSVAEQSEWVEHFEAERAKIRTLHEERGRVDGEIDGRVGELYGV